MITIMLVDDHPIIRRGVRTLLEAQPDMQVIGENGNGSEAIQMIERLRPDVVLLDLMIEGLNGIEVARRLRQDGCPTAIVIFSVLNNEHYVMEALRANIKGYILKESPTEEVLHAIREVAAGRCYLSSAVLNCTLDVLLKAAPQAGADGDQLRHLSAREREVLYLSAQGKTSAEMADQLYVSRRTVEAQRASMMRKLGLRNQQELICFAFQNGIIVPELVV